MRTKHYICFIFLFAGISAFTQIDTTKVIEKYKDADILILPYSPEMYINYEEVYLAKASGKTPEQINNFFRTELDKVIVDEFNKYAKTNSLLNNLTYDLNDDLQKIYHKSSYFYDEVGKKFKDFILFNTEKSKLADNKSQAEAGELYSPISNNENKFLNVRHADINFIRKIIQNNNANILIFITQLEIKGDYSNPYAVNSMTYNRRIKVHFTVFNKTGKNTGGGYVYDIFKADQNNLNEIVNVHFKKIAEKLISSTANAM